MIKKQSLHPRIIREGEVTCDLNVGYELSTYTALYSGFTLSFIP